MNTKTVKIRELNDQLRICHVGGQIVFSVEVSALSPYKEHDFGKISLAGEDYFWKIDYYDLDFCFHSPDAADPTVTRRVLTIMRADEW